MRHINVLYALSLVIGVADPLSAQLNLNRAPSRALGWPQLTVSNSNPNLDKEVHALDFLTGQERADLLAFLQSLTGSIPPGVGTAAGQTAPGE